LLIKTEKAFAKLELERRHDKIKRMSRQTEQWYEAIFNAAGEAIISTNMNGKIESMNTVARQLLVGDTNNFPYIQDVVAGFELSLLSLNEGEKSQNEYTVLHASGLTIPVHITVTRGKVGDMERMIFIMRDITEQKQAELAIRRVNELLEKRVSDRTKDLAEKNKELQAFSYSVSHDLRAPLRAINGFSAALVEDEAQNLSESGRSDLQRIINAAARMGNLIDDMLRLARLNEEKLQAQKISLSELVENILSQLRLSDPNRNVECVVAKEITANADPGLICVVLENLLSNAWKFTHHQPNARIEFGAEHHSNGLTYYIRDNGIGFDMKFVDKLFRTFSRLHNSHEYEGTGIGLTTSQRIIQRHNGKIWVDAEQGKGACFYFDLNVETS